MRMYGARPDTEAPPILGCRTGPAWAFMHGFIAASDTLD